MSKREYRIVSRDVSKGASGNNVGVPEMPCKTRSLRRRELSHTDLFSGRKIVLEYTVIGCVLFACTYLPARVRLDNTVRDDTTLIAWLIPAIMAIGTIVGSAIAARQNRRAVEATNRTNIQLAREQQEYNLQQWQAMNLYNSPEQQMQRLYLAGLNPQLVYSAGNVSGNAAGAPPQMDLPQLTAFQGHRYDVSGLSAAGNYLLTNRLHGAQLTHMEHQNAVLTQQALNETLRGAGLAINNAQSQHDYEVSRELKDNVVAMANANLEKLGAETSLINRNVDFEPLRRELTEAQIRNLRLAASKLQLDYDVDAFNLRLNQIGINQSDPVYVRILSRLLSPAWERGQNWLHNFQNRVIPGDNSLIPLR